MSERDAAVPGHDGVPPASASVGFAAYVVAFVVYVALGLVLKSAILNWLVGPLFLVVVLDVVPRIARRLTASAKS